MFTMTDTRTCLFIGLLACMVALMTASAHADSMVLVNDQLQELPATIVALDGSQVSYFDKQGILQQQPTSHFLMVRLIHDNPKPIAPTPATPATTTPPQQQPPETQTVVLIDGRKLIGTLVSTSQDGQTILLNNTLVGQLVFKLDQVKSWSMTDPLSASANPSSLELTTPTTQDTLTLRNGDRLTGYVAKVSLDAITFEPAGTTTAVTLPYSQIASMTLTNAPLPVTDTTMSRLYLADGSVLLVKDYLIQQGDLSFIPILSKIGEGNHHLAKRIVLKLNQLKRLDMANPNKRLIDWSSLTWKLTQGGKVFEMPLLPKLVGEDWFLHAPQVLEFELPEGTLAVGAQVNLDVQPDNPSRAWASLVVKLSANGSSPVSLPINGQQDHGQLLMPTHGAKLMVLTIDEADNGPIMDRIKLTNGWAVMAVTAKGK